MARGKKSRKSDTIVSSSVETNSGNVVEKTGDATARRFHWYDYIVVAVFFVVFMYIQKYFTLWFIGGDELTLEKHALDFFFDTLWKGFLIVAALVWLHDYFYRDPEDDKAT